MPQEVAHEVNLDVSHSDGLKLVDPENPTPPDVLVLPSKLKQFFKVYFFFSAAWMMFRISPQTVHTTTAINPSFLSRGTYALLKVSDGSGASNVKQRLNCEIARLEKQ